MWATLNGALGTASRLASSAVQQAGHVDFSRITQAAGTVLDAVEGYVAPPPRQAPVAADVTEGGPPATGDANVTVGGPPSGHPLLHPRDPDPGYLHLSGDAREEAGVADGGGDGRVGPGPAGHARGVGAVGAGLRLAETLGKQSRDRSDGWRDEGGWAGLFLRNA